MKCPICNQEIDYVIVESLCWQRAILAKDKNEIKVYDDIDGFGDINNIYCPECDEIITDAIKI